MVLDSKGIQQIIPHRWPFILVDKVLELAPAEGAVGIKNITTVEPWFQGHFPGYPIFPGVLIIEALAQLGAVVALSVPENKNKIVLFAGVDSFRFRQPVYPGDTLRLEVKFIKMRGNIGKGAAKASVGEKTVAEGELTFAIVNKD